ncbi:hypothetical protein TNCV_3949591 [Trichonephila clavipes]|nr:hypothetical protein TNCV_3949591 [Trichonephila clavipes]
MVAQDCLSKRKNNKQTFLSMEYALPLLHWLLRTVSPDCPTVLEVRVPIPQTASVSVVGCSPEDVIVPQGGLLKATYTCFMGFKSGENAG